MTFSFSITSLLPLSPLLMPQLPVVAETPALGMTIRRFEVSDWMITVVGDDREVSYVAEDRQSVDTAYPLLLTDHACGGGTLSPHDALSSDEATWLTSGATVVAVSEIGGCVTLTLDDGGTICLVSAEAHPQWSVTCEETAEETSTY